MNNNEFDKKITDVVDEAQMPFSDDNWAAMQQMLDKKSSRKLLALPLLFKPFAAAAAVLVLLASLYVFTQQAGNTADKTIAKTEQPAIMQLPEPAPLPNTIEKDLAIAKTYPVIAQQQKPTTAELKRQPVLVAQADTEDSSLPEENIIVATEQKSSPHKPQTSLNDYYPVDEYDDNQGGKVTFGVNTGVAMYESSNNFTAGLIVKNQLSNRVSLQAGLNFVGGRQSVSVKHVDVSYVPSDNGLYTEPKKVETERYEEYSRNLPYVQFNPSVSVQLFKKLYGAVGADVQRLIINKPALDTMNQQLAEVGKKIPQTDPGVTLSMNYRITKHIGMGVSYRNSVAGIATDNIEYVKRNYFLVQLQYIFNAK